MEWRRDVFQGSSRLPYVNVKILLYRLLSGKASATTRLQICKSATKKVTRCWKGLIIVLVAAAAAAAAVAVVTPALIGLGFPLFPFRTLHDDCPPGSASRSTVRRSQHATTF